MVKDKIIQQFNSPQEAADAINQKFYEVYRQKKEFVVENVAPDISYCITPNDVEELLEKFDFKKSFYDDVAPAVFYNKATYILSKPLADIFTNSFQNCLLPNEWKENLVIPLPKSKQVSISNLRPISLCKLPAKILEKFMLQRIKCIISKELNDDQFGFRAQSSTCAAMIKLLHVTTNFLDKTNVLAVSLVAIDFKKAFDSTSHYVLLEKLSKCVPLDILLWLKDFLRKRTQKVKLTNIFSSTKPITSGVPQGSVLSPILFNLFINDLCAPKGSFCIKFADDATFIVPHYKSDTFDETTNTMQHIQLWAAKNEIEINLTKTQILTIRGNRFLHHNNLSRISEMKMLGVYLTHNLSWKKHLDYVTKKIASKLHLLRKLKNILSKKDLILCYYAHIDSILNYCSSVFIYLPFYLQEQLRKLANRAHSIICHKFCSEDCIPNPTKRRIEASIKLFLHAKEDPHHILHNIIPHTLPRTKRFFVHHCNTSQRAQQFIPQCVQILNNTNHRF